MGAPFLEGRPRAVLLTSVTQHLLNEGFRALEADFSAQGGKTLKNKILRFILIIAMNISCIKVRNSAT